MKPVMAITSIRSQPTSTPPTVEGSWDATHLTVRQSAWNAQFVLTMSEMTDIWGLANGFSHQIVQIYVDKGDELWPYTMLTGANAEVHPDWAWEVAISGTGNQERSKRFRPKRAAPPLEASTSAETLRRKPSVYRKQGRDRLRHPELPLHHRHRQSRRLWHWKVARRDGRACNLDAWGRGKSCT